MSEALRRHRRSIWLSVFLITLAGLVAALRLPVSLFPHIDYPRVVVSIDADDEHLLGLYEAAGMRVHERHDLFVKGL